MRNERRAVALAGLAHPCRTLNKALLDYLLESATDWNLCLTIRLSKQVRVRRQILCQTERMVTMNSSRSTVSRMNGGSSKTTHCPANLGEFHPSTFPVVALAVVASTQENGSSQKCQMNSKRQSAFSLWHAPITSMESFPLCFGANNKHAAWQRAHGPIACRCVDFNPIIVPVIPLFCVKHFVCCNKEQRQWQG